ncbi:DET1 homolog [Zeugodacus cucurbitae]|uniref:DET1 homolog n=1 Tax=Zeugodacus cucurbitae TaxID=28588 RepID=A0A0A1WVF9_ZEUCU|nr:DET1 homolog [Zeugodacus cucurbitae]
MMESLVRAVIVLNDFLEEVNAAPCYRETRHSWFTERALTQNLQHHLWDRESGLNRYNRRGRVPVLTHEQEFYKSFTPNLSILNVGSTLGFIRKFTPDGKLLLCFSAEHNCICVYKYIGVGRVQHALFGIKSEAVPATFQTGVLLTRQLFPLLWRIQIFPETERDWQLHREFSIFIDEGRYVLLAAKSIMGNSNMPREHYLNFPDLYDNTDISDYTFYLIDLHKGVISDVYKLRDFVFLSHNYGVSIAGHTIAILSRCRQCIDVLQVREGKFFLQYQVNREQETTRREELEIELHTKGVPEPFMKGIYSPLKQHCLSYLFKEAYSDEIEQPEKLRLFYRNFKAYEEMHITKMQLIDEDTLLIRFEIPKRPSSSDAGNENFNAQNPNFKLFVFYSISEDSVFKIYRDDSKELVYLQRNYYDYFRKVRSAQTRRPASSPSNNVYFRTAFNCAFKSSGGVNKAATRLNTNLPINAQGACCSPYFDYNMFNYNDRSITALEVPKVLNPNPIVFTDRYTNVLKFRLYLETSLLARNKQKQLVSFVFHPFEPFAISVQQIAINSYLVNFHIFCETTVVAPGPRQLKSDIWPDLCPGFQ